MKNKEVTKQVVGIDIGMESFYVCYKVQYGNGRVVIKGTKSFYNTALGMKDFFLWTEKRNKNLEISLVFVMEATGVYYEELAYFLHYKKQKISVQLAQKIKYFAKSCNLKTKNDKVDSKMIAEFGIEKNLSKIDFWTPPSKNFKMIRDLSREHTSLKQSIVGIKSQLHALNFAHETNKEVVKMKKQQIVFYEKQIISVEKAMRKLVKADSKLYEKIKKIETVKGLAFVSIIKVISEVNGFLLFNNIRQLVSYAGLDVIEKESGKFIGKTKISKKGNAQIRTALYMPAMSAMQHNRTLKTFYERVNEGRTIKKQGVIAVMRKLLILIYTLWKKDEEYIEDYQQKITEKKAA
ncbi:MAG: IS110 family transposase [Bacteroidetes bacterium]|nr:MAG: IS110 family transposase [Bacteroidota bacterium]